MNFLIYNVAFAMLYAFYEFLFQKFGFIGESFNFSSDLNFLILNIFLSSLSLWLLKRKYLEWEEN